ncbi:YopX family protein [Ruminiclostridium josui]|uniref:YopX family protein n=1 Tax=Ruminiclostridium josui TaxID=1499 RepID=UPI0004668A54|nr:YopX family protein [Ruminiclostridium josui]
MREIKARGKRTDNGEWVYGCYLKRWIGAKYKHYIHDGLLEFEVIPETVGEFTGLHDKKRTEQYPEGQEIYEGDILTQSFTDEDGKIKSFSPLLVKYVQSQFVGENKVLDRLHGLWADIEHEIIGNIHDNPELIPELIKESEDNEKL